MGGSPLSVPTIAALSAGGAVLLAAFFAGIVSVITAWRTIANKVSAIEGHVNSEKTAAEGREATLKRENELLKEMLVDRKQTAALLAQAASHPASRTIGIPETPAVQQVEVVNTPEAAVQVISKKP